MGQAITIVASGGLAVTEATTGFGLPVEEVASGGIACTVVADGGLPIVGYTAPGGGGGAGSPIGLLLSLTKAA